MDWSLGLIAWPDFWAMTRWMAKADEARSWSIWGETIRLLPKDRVPIIPWCTRNPHEFHYLIAKCTNLADKHRWRLQIQRYRYNAHFRCLQPFELIKPPSKTHSIVVHPRLKSLTLASVKIIQFHAALSGCSLRAEFLYKALEESAHICLRCGCNLQLNPNGQSTHHFDEEKLAPLLGFTSNGSKSFQASEKLRWLLLKLYFSWPIKMTNLTA